MRQNRFIDMLAIDNDNLFGLESENNDDFLSDLASRTDKERVAESGLGNQFLGMDPSIKKKDE